VIPDASAQGGWQVAGSAGGTGILEPRVFAAHLTTPGAFDPGFGTGGYFVFPASPGNLGQIYFGNGSMGIGVVQLPSGQLAADEYFQNGIGNLNFLGYTPGGSQTGSLLADAYSIPIVRPVTDDTGRIFTVVWYDGPLSVMRTDNKGALDATYQSTTSEASLNTNNGQVPWASAVYPSTDPDGNAGKVLVGGSATSGGFLLYRFNADGTTDTAFNTQVAGLAGLFSVNANITSLTVTGIRISGSTTALVLQNNAAVSGSNPISTSYLVVLNGDGTLNTDFVWPASEVSGGVLPLPGNTFRAYDLAIGADGSIVVVGDTSSQSGFAMIYKYSSSGGAPVGTSLGDSSAVSGARAVAIDAAGNLGVGGFIRRTGFDPNNTFDATAHFWTLATGTY
jgi:hypothetical protein